MVKEHSLIKKEMNIQENLKMIRNMGLEK